MKAILVEEFKKDFRLKKSWSQRYAAPSTRWCAYTRLASATPTSMPRTTGRLNALAQDTRASASSKSRRVGHEHQARRSRGHPWLYSACGDAATA